MFRDKLYFILNDINKHKRPPDQLMEVCIAERLETALETYMNSLNSSAEYVTKQDSLNVLKKINKQGM